MVQPKRLSLHQLLLDLLGSGNVYFQPREEQNLTYPAIVYKKDNARSENADNLPYKLQDRYQVTYIDRSPDSDVPRTIQLLPMSRLTSVFVSDGLNHYNHSLYF